MLVDVTARVELYSEKMLGEKLGFRYEYEFDKLRLVNGGGDLCIVIEKDEIIKHKEEFRGLCNTIQDIIQDERV